MKFTKLVFLVCICWKYKKKPCSSEMLSNVVLSVEVLLWHFLWKVFYNYFLVSDVPYRGPIQVLQGIYSMRAVTLSHWQLCGPDKVYSFFLLLPQLGVIGPGTVCSNLCELLFECCFCFSGMLFCTLEILAADLNKKWPVIHWKLRKKYWHGICFMIRYRSFCLVINTILLLAVNWFGSF